MGISLSKHGPKQVACINDLKLESPRSTNEQGELGVDENTNNTACKKTTLYHSGSVIVYEKHPEVEMAHHGSNREKIQEVVMSQNSCKQHHGNTKDQASQIAAKNKNHGSDPNEAVMNRVPEQISNIWSKIDDGLQKWLTLNTNRPDTTKKGWKVVRLFVSSTFTDFFSEREVLVKRVVPQLNEWCQARKIQLIECDLRWGIPKDSTANDTIDICLNEIEKCLEETGGQAFFLNFLGGRYGWIPDLQHISKEVVDKYDLVDGMSITHTEILHASLRSNSKNALFLFRDDCIIPQIPAGVRPLFVEDTEFGAQSLVELKQQLRDRFPKQVMKYSCTFDSFESTPETTKVALAGLEDFEDKVIGFFKAAIERMYPQIDEDLTSVEFNFVFQDIFIEKKGALLVGRETEKKQIIDFVSISNDCGALAQNYMLVTGPSGIGKSSLLANVVRQLKDSNVKCIYNFASASPDSTVSTAVREIFTKKLLQWLGLNHDGFDDMMYEDKVSKYKEIIRLVCKEQRQMTLVFDAVNQFSNTEAPFLNWLPADLQGSFKCIIGCTDDSPLLGSIKRQLDTVGFKELHITGFGPTESKEFITSLFSRYNKKLDEEQMEAFVSRNEACNPLWLSLSCEELRIFGQFERLSDKIRTLPDDLQELVFTVLQRLISEDKTGLIKDTIYFLVCSTSGLTETELRWSNGNTEEPVPLMIWKRCRFLLQPYLLMVGKRRGEENFAFFHDSFNIVVRGKLLADMTEKRSYHSKLAQVFKISCTDDIRVAEELPAQLELANEYAALLDFYRKDRRSMRNNQRDKSFKLKKIRCQTMVLGPKDKFCSPVYICHMCSNRMNAFTPIPGLNKDLCVLCGGHVPFKKDDALAYVCMKHKDFTAPGTAKCCVCKSVIFLQQKARICFNQMYLCRYCTFSGQRCVKLQY